MSSIDDQYDGPRSYAVAHLHTVEIGPEIRRYLEEVESTFEPFGGTWVVHGARAEVVEGPWTGDLVIIAFPSMAAARAWYASPAYQAIVSLRTEHSTGDAVLVPGVPPGYRARDTLAKLATA